MRFHLRLHHCASRCALIVAVSEPWRNVFAQTVDSYRQSRVQHKFGGKVGNEERLVAHKHSGVCHQPIASVITVACYYYYFHSLSDVEGGENYLLFISSLRLYISGKCA